MASALAVIIILLTMAYFYLKCRLAASLTTLLAIVLALAASLGLHPALAQLLLGYGYGGAYAYAGAVAVVFIFTFALLRGLSDYLMPVIELPKWIDQLASVVCGLAGGVLIAGVALVALGLLPVEHKLLYNRYPADKPLLLAAPSKPIIPADSIAVGLYSWLSRGALASKTSFAVAQADYLARIHLNRYHLKEGIIPIAGMEALVVPPKAKSPVRLMTFPDAGSLTVVRVGISTRPIADGGAADETFAVKAFVGQIRLIVKPDSQADTLTGAGSAVWPVGIVNKNGKLVEKKLDQILDLEKDALGQHGDAIWLDVAFRTPTGQSPVLIQFKSNSQASLIGIRPVPSSPEIEQALNEMLAQQ